MRRGSFRTVAVLATVLVSGTAVALAAAPSATTGAASGVDHESATVHGTVNPQGQATTYHFEYGTTSAYGSQTTDTSAGSGTSNADVSAALGGLKANTTYHYRLVAASSQGTTDGADRSFTTAKLPAPAVTTQAASSITPTSARLNGSVGPNGQETTYHFEYGLSKSYGSRTAETAAGHGTGSTDVSAAISGLSGGKTYHFRIVATSPGGTTNGGDRSFTAT